MYIRKEVDSLCMNGRDTNTHPVYTKIPVHINTAKLKGTVLHIIWTEVYTAIQTLSEEEKWPW